MKKLPEWVGAGMAQAGADQMKHMTAVFTILQKANGNEAEAKKGILEYFDKAGMDVPPAIRTMFMK